MQMSQRFVLRVAGLPYRSLRRAARLLCPGTQKLPAMKYGRLWFSSVANDRGSFRKILEGCGGGSVDLTKHPPEGVAVITINNPDRKNALSGKMMLDLRSVVTELESWEMGKGVILVGSQGTFCSGGDLSTVQKILTPELGFKMAEYMHETLTRFSQLPMVSLALVQGNALGGGAELTTACDFRVLTSTARVGFVQMKMGVVTGWGGGTRLVRLIGYTKALQVLCSSKVLSSEECVRLGLADHVIPCDHSSAEACDHVLKTGHAWLSQYCHADAQLVRDMKTIARTASERDYTSSLERERTVFGQTWGGSAQKAALDGNIKHS